VECGVNKEVLDHLFYLSPQRGTEGKFSLQYCVAIAILDGKVGIGQFTDEKVQTPAVHDFMKKISIYEHPEQKGRPSKDQFSEVTVHLKDGRLFSNRVTLVRGRPGNPLKYEEIVSKFKECAATVLTNTSVDHLLELVENIQALDNISELATILNIKK